MIEEWKVIQDFPDYSISNTGSIKRITTGVHTYPGRIVKQTQNRKGYRRVTLHKNKHHTLLVHSLVAKAFIGTKPNGMEINHIDGIKNNNMVTNLEYVTPKENSRHALKLGLMKPLHGEKNGNHKLTAQDVTKIKQLLRQGIRPTRIAEQFNVWIGTIGHISAGRSWKNLTDT